MRWYFALLAVVATLLGLAAAGIGWLVGTEAGLHWAAGKVPQLQAEELHGRLAGEITAKKIVFASEGLRVEVDDVLLRPHLAALLGGRLAIEPLRAKKALVQLASTPSQSGGAAKLPLGLDLRQVAIDAIEVERAGATYRVEDVALEHLRIGTDVSALGAVTWPHEEYRTRAKVRLGGKLERLEVQAEADVAGVPAQAQAVFTQKLESLELRAGPVDLQRFVKAVPHTALDALVKANVDASGAFIGTISLNNAAPGAVDAGRLPVVGAQARFRTDFTTATITDLRVSLPGDGRLSGEAEVSRERVEAKLVASYVDLRSLYSTLRRTALHGPFQVVLAGERQFARGTLTQEGLGFTAEVVRTGDRIQIQELRALIERGEVAGTGEIRLGEAMRFTARLAATDFNPAALGDYPAGALNGWLVAQGELKEFDAQWRFERSTLYEHEFESEGSARVAGLRVTQADAEVRQGENRLSAKGAFGRPGDELAVTLEAPRLEQFGPASGRVRAKGTLSGTLDNPRARITAAAEELTIGGVQLTTVNATLAGTIGAHDVEIRVEAPQYAVELEARLLGGWTSARGWSGDIRWLRNSGEYPVELATPAPLRAAPGRVELGRFEARLQQGRILVREAAWTPARMASSGEFAGLPAQWLIVAAGLGERVGATLLLDGEWQLAKGADIEGVVRVRRASGDVALQADAPVELGLERFVLEARFAQGRARGQVEAVSRVARLNAQGDVLPNLAVEGKVDFAELSALVRPFAENFRVDGRLAAQLRLTGTLASPVFHGALLGEGIVMDYPPYGLALKDGRFRAQLDGDSLRLESFEIRGGEGRFLAEGTLPLALNKTASVKWRAEKLAALDRPDMRLVVTGSGEAAYDGQKASLTGELRADRGHFEFARDKLPKLSDDVVIIGDTKIVRPKVKGKMKLPVALDLRIDLGDSLVVRGYGYDGKLAGLIDLATTKDGELRAFGRLTAVHATFLAYGKTLEVDPGVLIFDGPIDNPSLQITAWRRNQAVEAGVQITGTARAPSVNLVSQPPVPEGERLSWLVLGRPPSGATQADIGLLQAAAGALLAGGDSVPLDRRIARRFGFDELTLRGSGELTGQVLAVGKRLSDRLYISYEQGIGAVAQNLIKLDYALGRRWTVRAETGTSSGGGLFYRYSWD